MSEKQRALQVTFLAKLATSLRGVLAGLAEEGVSDFQEFEAGVRSLEAKALLVQTTLFPIEDDLPTDGTAFISLRIPGERSFKIRVTPEVISIIKEMRILGMYTAKNEIPAFSESQHTILIFWGEKGLLQNYKFELKLPEAGEHMQLKPQFQSYVDRLLAFKVE